MNDHFSEQLITQMKKMNGVLGGIEYQLSLICNELSRTNEAILDISSRELE